MSGSRASTGLPTSRGSSSHQQRRSGSRQELRLGTVVRTATRPDRPGARPAHRHQPRRSTTQGPSGSRSRRDCAPLRQQIAADKARGEARGRREVAPIYPLLDLAGGQLVLAQAEQARETAAAHAARADEHVRRLAAADDRGRLALRLAGTSRKEHLKLEEQAVEQRAAGWREAAEARIAAAGPLRRRGRFCGRVRTPPCWVPRNTGRRMSAPLRPGSPRCERRSSPRLCQLTSSTVAVAVPDTCRASPVYVIVYSAYMFQSGGVSLKLKVPSRRTFASGSSRPLRVTLT